MVRHVLFDLNGTLVNPQAMAMPLGHGQASRELVDGALSDAVHAATVDTITGGFEEFQDLLREALKRRLALVHREQALEEVIAAAKRMPPFPEARECIDELKQAGIGTGVLTNSSASSARGLVEGLPALEPIIGTDEIGAFKPHPRVYRHALDRLGAEAEEVLLVSAHWWDALGAKRAGLRSAWVSRREHVLFELEPRPDMVGEDLLAVARAVGEEAIGD